MGGSCLQRQKLEQLYSTRDEAAVRGALESLTSCAAAEGPGSGNLLDLSIQVRYEDRVS